MEMVLEKFASADILESVKEHCDEVPRYSRNFFTWEAKEGFDKYSQNNVYCPTCILRAFDSKKNVFHEKYVGAFNRVMEDSPRYKRQLDAFRVCVGMDRALFFLQIYGGIPHIEEVKFEDLFVLLSIILEDDFFFCSELNIHILETWYWAVMLHGEFEENSEKAFETYLVKFKESNKRRSYIHFDWIRECVFKKKTYQPTAQYIKDVNCYFYLARRENPILSGKLILMKRRTCFYLAEPKDYKRMVAKEKLSTFEDIEDYIKESLAYC